MIQKILPFLFLVSSVWAVENEVKFNAGFVKTEYKIAGKTYQLSDKKEPLIFLNYWASWCRPCIAEFKSLNKFIKKYDGKVFVLGINNDDEKPSKKILRTSEKYKLLFPSVPDIEGNYAERFMVSRIPTTVMFFRGKFFKSVPREFDFMSEDFLKLIDKKLKTLD